MRMQKAAVISLSAILAFGLLVQSVTRFCLDILLSPSAALQEHKITQRLFLRHLSESTCAVFCGLYVLILIVFAVIHIKRNYQIPLTQLSLFFISQIGIIGICTIPFAILSSFAYGDYLTPFFMVTPTLLLVCILYKVLLYLRNNRRKNTEQSH